MLPEDKSYLEIDIPIQIQNSIKAMEKEWVLIDKGTPSLRYDAVWQELNADIGAYEADGIISENQACYLREKYLRMSRKDNT